MLPDDGFLGQLRERPDDEPLRLVYADFWDDRGDPRGEFLRLESRLLALPEGSAEYAELKARLAEVAAGIDVRWRAAVGQVHVETGPPFDHPRRLSLNVPGPFYTCGDCMACEAPEVEAPDLLAPLETYNGVTRFVRQPETTAEIQRACGAVGVCCVSDVRYAGTDPLVIRRLGNSPTTCDFLISDESSVLVPAGVSVTSPPRPTTSLTIPNMFVGFDQAEPAYETPLARYAEQVSNTLMRCLLALCGTGMLVGVYVTGALPWILLGAACGVGYLGIEWLVRWVRRSRG